MGLIELMSSEAVSPSGRPLRAAAANDGKSLVSAGSSPGLRAFSRPLSPSADDEQRAGLAVIVLAGVVGVAALREPLGHRRVQHA